MGPGLAKDCTQLTLDSIVSSHRTELPERVRARLGGALGCKISEALTLRLEQVQGWHGMTLRACASLHFTPEMPHCLILILALLILPLSPQPSWVRGSFCLALRSLPPSLMPLTFLWGPLGSGCSELQKQLLLLDSADSTSLLALTSFLPLDFLHLPLLGP